MAYVIEQPPVPSLPVAGGRDRFPVRRIYCIGRNYRAHAIEMGHDPDREPPFFFMKPGDAVVESGSAIPFPMATSDLHHEIELVAAIGKGGVHIPEARALDHVWGYGVGLDLTRRDLQGAAKDLRRPWDMGKGFDQSAPCSALRPAAEIGHPESGAIWLRINGEVRQQSDLRYHIWTLPETIAILSRLVALAPGDLIFMGTPEGVGPIRPGDRLEGHVDGVGDLVVTIG
ncbi:MAG TPA: fumarylacetoacetate hydrolase family protein [Thermodesulfobacteriota bacterium]